MFFHKFDIDFDFDLDKLVESVDPPRAVGIATVSASRDDGSDGPDIAGGLLYDIALSEADDSGDALLEANFLLAGVAGDHAASHSASFEAEIDVAAAEDALAGLQTFADWFDGLV